MITYPKFLSLDNIDILKSTTSMNYYESFFSYQACGDNETKWGREEAREENLALPLTTPYLH